MLLNSLGTHLQLKRNAHLSLLTEFLSQLCLPPEFLTIQSPPPLFLNYLIKLMSDTNFPSHRHLIMSSLFLWGLLTCISEKLCVTGLQTIPQSALGASVAQQSPSQF